MTNEYNFKIGDKVATKKPYDIAINGNTTTIPIGDEGVIENVDGEELLVDFPGYFCALTLNIADVEPIQPLDRRTAFLTRLQSLLREFDATICGGLSDTHNDDVIYISIGDDEIAYRNGEMGVSFASITADNIMDFDKE